MVYSKVGCVRHPLITMANAGLGMDRLAGAGFNLRPPDYERPSSDYRNCLTD